MTIVNVKVGTKADRIQRERKEWVNEAAEYFFTLGVFGRDGGRDERDCYSVADSVYENCMDKDGSVDRDVYDPKSAVDEELTYWGE